MSSNCLRLGSILTRKFCFNMAVESKRSKYIRSKFTLKNSIWLILISGLLEAKRVNKSCVGAEIKNIYESLCL